LSDFDGANTQEWATAALFIETAIQAAEPRLKDIRVKVENYNAIEQILSLTVSAFINHLDVYQEIHFPLELQHRPQVERKKSA
jgi:predicted component of type VI protein secretion system